MTPSPGQDIFHTESGNRRHFLAGGAGRVGCPGREPGYPQRRGTAL